MSTAVESTNSERRSSRRSSGVSTREPQLYVRFSTRTEIGGERSPIVIGIFDSLEEGGKVDNEEEAIPNANPWEVDLPMETRKIMFDFLKEVTEARRPHKKRPRKRPISPTKNDVPRDRTNTVEACKTRFANGMKRLPGLGRKLVELEADVLESRETLLKVRQIVETTNVKEAKVKILLRYILEGESGVIDVGVREIIFVDELHREITQDHLSKDDTGVDNSNKRTSMVYSSIRLNKETSGFLFESRS